MPKVMIARIIEHKTNMHNGRCRSICSSITKAADFLTNLFVNKEEISASECIRALALTAANNLCLSEIVKHLEVSNRSDQYQDTTCPESALIAATCMQRASTVKKLVEVGAIATRRTRYFGDAMTAAARSGSEDILNHFLDTSQCSSGMSSPMESLSHTTALEAASAAGQEQAVSVLLRRAPLLRPHVLFDAAIQSATQGNHESIALMILQQRKPLDPDREYTFWFNLLRKASESACDTIVDFFLQSSQPSLSEEHMALAIEDAGQRGHVSTMQLLFSPPPGPAKLEGATFLAAFHGNEEIVDLLIGDCSDSDSCLIPDALAGAILRGRIDLLRHILQRTTGSPESKLPHFDSAKFETYVDAIHFWLDSRQDCPRDTTASPPSTLPLNQALWTACEQGDIRKIRRMFPARVPSRENLSFLCSAAAKKGHPGLLLYLVQFVPPYLLPAVALEARSRAILHVFLTLGWNLNEPLSRISPPLLGYVSYPTLRDISGPPQLNRT